MHGHATGYVFYNWQSALKIQDSGEVGCMDPWACCTAPGMLQTSMHTGGCKYAGNLLHGAGEAVLRQLPRVRCPHPAADWADRGT